jgi:hypothetical protein
MLGVKLVIVGAPELVVTVKLVLLVALPAGLVTVIGPVVAAPGTVTTIWVALAETMLAETPLNCTLSWLAVGLKPVPLMVTEAPEEPLPGVKEMIDICSELWRAIESMFPAASYL